MKADSRPPRIVVIGSINVTYSENQPTGSGNNLSSSNSSNLYAGANVSWQMLRWLSLNGNYTYLLRSNPSGSLTGSGNIPVNTATVSLGATF